MKRERETQTNGALDQLEEMFEENFDDVVIPWDVEPLSDDDFVIPWDLEPVSDDEHQDEDDKEQANS